MPTLTANEEFLYAHTLDAIGEVVGLINDVIDMVGYASRRTDAKTEYAQRALVFFLYHILQPSSYAIYLNLIAANLPACFFELRLVHEALVKCYLADLRYSDRLLFKKRLEALAKKERNTSELMRELGEKVGENDKFVDLWQFLSNEWVHSKGATDRIAESITEKETISPWGLVVPNEYTPDDLDVIDELRQKVSLFRYLLKISFEKYKEELDYSEG